MSVHERRVKTKYKRYIVLFGATKDIYIHNNYAIDFIII